MENKKNKVNKGKKQGFIASTMSMGSISENHNYIKEVAYSLIKKKDPNDIIEETYEDAVKRLDVTKDDINKNYINFVYSLYASLFFAGVCFVGSIFSLFVNKSIMVGISFLVMMLVCLINSFRFSFRAFQIKEKNLCSPNEWWNSSSEWIPNIFKNK